MSRPISVSHHIRDILFSSEKLQGVLHALRNTEHPQLWLAGGVVRNTIWDYLFEIETDTVWNDVDVIYLGNGSQEEEQRLEDHLRLEFPHVPWSVKDQIRMAEKHNHSPYYSISEAISYWVETATAIAVRLDKANGLHIMAPFGFTDLLEGVVRPGSPHKASLAKQRMIEKEWLNRWTALKWLEE